VGSASFVGVVKELCAGVFVKSFRELLLTDVRGRRRLEAVLLDNACVVSAKGCGQGGTWSRDLRGVERV